MFYRCNLNFVYQNFETETHVMQILTKGTESWNKVANSDFRV